ADAVAAHPLPPELHAGEGAVSLVEVHASRRDAQRSESPDTTDAEQQFLADPDALVAAVQACGQLAVFRLVAVDVGIEQQQRDPPDRHLHDSGGDRSRARLDRDRDRLAAGARRGLNREHTRAELEIVILLPALKVEPLTEVALIVVEPDADQGNAEVRGALEMIPGEDAETAGVDWDRLVQPELGREVRHR